MTSTILDKKSLKAPSQVYIFSNVQKEHVKSLCTVLNSLELSILPSRNNSDKKVNSTG